MKLFALLPLCFLGSQDYSHFHYAGPLASIVNDGVSVGAETSGRRISLPLEYRQIQSSWEWKPVQAGKSQSPTVAFSDLKLNGDRLTGNVSVRNDGPTSLEGLRLDFISASEKYKAKDANGKDIDRFRSLPGKMDSAILFADLGVNESLVFPFSVTGLSQHSDGLASYVDFGLSGLRFDRTIKVPNGDGGLYTLDPGPGGRLLACSSTGVYLVDPSSGSSSQVVKASNARGSTVDKNGDIWVVWDNKNLGRYGLDGSLKQSTLADGEALDWLTLGIRIGSDGSFYNSGDNQREIQCIGADGKRKWKTSSLNDSLFLFDVDTAGVVYGVSNEGEEGPNRGLGFVETLGNAQPAKAWWRSHGPKPGQCLNPVSVRIEPTTGRVWVLEGGWVKNGEINRPDEAARVSVFTSKMELIRVLGRGGTKPGGHFVDPLDMCFLPGGRVAIGCKDTDTSFQIRLYSAL